MRQMNGKTTRKGISYSGFQASISPHPIAKKGTEYISSVKYLKLALTRIPYRIKARISRNLTFYDTLSFGIHSRQLIRWITHYSLFLIH